MIPTQFRRWFAPPAGKTNVTSQSRQALTDKFLATLYDAVQITLLSLIRFGPGEKTYKPANVIVELLNGIGARLTKVTDVPSLQRALSAAYEVDPSIVNRLDNDPLINAAVEATKGRVTKVNTSGVGWLLLGLGGLLLLSRRR